MTAMHTFTPAPRNGAVDAADAADVHSPARAAEVLRAARTLAGADPSPERCDGASALAVGPACARAVECERPGVITVVTEDDTTHLCGMHAMTAVFTTPGLLALVKPDGM